VIRFIFLFFLACLLILQLREAAAADWQVTDSRSSRTNDPAVDHLRQQVRVKGEDRRIWIDLVLFDDRQVQLQVVDNPTEPRPHLMEAMKKSGAIAGINGGYFHPDYRPAGMIVSKGKVVAKPEKAKLLSGAIVVDSDGVEILRYRELPDVSSLKAGIQAGPFLIDGGQVVQGLSHDRRAKRTIVATDGGHRHALIVTGPLTLAQAAEMLDELTLTPEWKIERALNLDGGSSTTLYVAKPNGAPHYEASWGTVRNFLALFPNKD